MGLLGKSPTAAADVPETPVVADAIVTAPKPHHAIIDEWLRDTFHGSAVGRELSDLSQKRVREACDSLKAKLDSLIR